MSQNCQVSLDVELFTALFELFLLICTLLGHRHFGAQMVQTIPLFSSGLLSLPDLLI